MGRRPRERCVTSRLATLEPSMEYLCDEDHLNWKVKQVTHVLEHELPVYEESLSYNYEE